MSKKIINFLGLPERYHGIPAVWFLSVVLVITIVFSGCGGCGGCDGCNCFKGKVDITPVRESGNAIISIQNITVLGTQNETTVVSVSYSGTLTGAGSGSGDASFSINRNYEVTRASVTPAPSYERKNLKPGNWEITVRVGNWSARRQGTIRANQGTTFSFVYGQ